MAMTSAARGTRAFGTAAAVWGLLGAAALLLNAVVRLAPVAPRRSPPTAWTPGSGSSRSGASPSWATSKATGGSSRGSRRASCGRCTSHQPSTAARDPRAALLHGAHPRFAAAARRELGAPRVDRGDRAGRASAAAALPRDHRRGRGVRPGLGAGRARGFRMGGGRRGAMRLGSASLTSTSGALLPPDRNAGRPRVCAPCQRASGEMRRAAARTPSARRPSPPT